MTPVTVPTKVTVSPSSMNSSPYVQVIASAGGSAALATVSLSITVPSPSVTVKTNEYRYHGIRTTPRTPLEQAGSHQSAWMTVPPCRVDTRARLLASVTAPRSLAQLAMASCQCRLMPAGVW